MNTIHLNIDKFLSYNPIKPGIVHKKKKLVYKYAPTTQSMMSFLDGQRYEDVLSHVSLAKAFLYSRDEYWGYAMKYYERLTSIKTYFNRFNKDRNRIDQYVKELINVLIELEKLELCYNDFHFNNVMVDEGGKPFLLDADHMRVEPDRKFLNFQRARLINFILNIYTDSNYDLLNKFINELELKDYFSKDFVRYLGEGYKHYKVDELIPFFPLEFLNEFRDLDKMDEIKRILER